MTKCRKALSLLLTILMVFSLFPMMVSADETGTGSTGPVWPEEGAVLLNKTAQAVSGQENMWEITLTVEGKNYKTTSDVVLVIDCSGSMEGSKLTNTRKAAKAFGERLLTEGSSTRIAIVTYIDKATAYNNGHFYGAGELAAFQTAVDKATYADGGTNQQAGLHKAQELLTSAASTGKLKNIVILSDGEPTYSHPFVATATYSYCEAWTNIGCPRDGRITNIGAFTPNYGARIGSGSGFALDYNAEVIATCPKHGNSTTRNYVYALDGTFTTSSGTNNGVATIWEANQAKAAGTTIFSVALQAGTNGENTLKACATDPTENKGYFAIGTGDDAASKLETAFTQIAGSIAIAASNAVATDTMGEKVQLSLKDSTAPVITNDLTEYTNGNADIYVSQGTVTYDAATETIGWNVGNVREGDIPTLKYKVGLDPDYINDVKTGDKILTNEKASLTYTNYEGKETTKDFPKPEVTIGGGTILVHWYLVNGNGEPINSAGEVVEGPGYAKQVQNASYFRLDEQDPEKGLEYGSYTVGMTAFDNYSYYGYILNNGALVKGDESVEVTLNASNPNQEVWFAYTQGFNVVHVQNGEVKNTVSYTIGETVDGIYKDGLFNLTATVTDGYLYGGTFERDYTAVHHEFTDANAKNPMSFRPTAGETYYIWEVNKDYLRPRSVSGARTTSAGTDVVGFFIMTPIDREYYSEVGFTVNDNDVLKANQVAEWYVTNDETTTNLSNLDRTVVYKEFQILKTNNQYDTYTVGSFSTSSGISTGYLACVSLDKTAYWNNAGDEITFVPYWITMDGVKVTNMTRTCKYLGVGANDDAHRMIGMIAEKENDATSITYVNTIQTQNVEPLMVMAAYCGGNTVDSNPEQPIEPVQPTEPEVPEKDTVTVTVVDYDTKYVLELQSGDVTEYIKYTGEKNCLFAGWYTDEAYTNPADFTYVTEDITIFAKYVSDNYLRLSYDEKRSYSNWKRTLTLSTTAPEDDFREIGFLVNGEMCIAKDKKSFGYGERFNDQYDSSYNFVYAFGFGFGYPAFGEKPVDLERTLTYALSVTRGETYEITPYWVTMDGTTVYGESRTLNVQRYGVNG